MNEEVKYLKMASGCPHRREKSIDIGVGRIDGCSAWMGKERPCRGDLCPRLKGGHKHE